MQDHRQGNVINSKQRTHTVKCILAHLMVETSIGAWLVGRSLSGVSSTLTLRTERESSLNVVDDTAPEP